MSWLFVTEKYSQRRSAILYKSCYLGPSDELVLLYLVNQDSLTTLPNPTVKMRCSILSLESYQSDLLLLKLTPEVSFPEKLIPAELFNRNTQRMFYNQVS